MAHKKGVGSSKNGRDSNSQRLGLKEPDGKLVTGGSIIIRQKGNKWWAGKNAGQGSDFTIYAKVPGMVKLERKKSGKAFVHIVPLVDEPAA